MPKKLLLTNRLVCLEAGDEVEAFVIEADHPGAEHDVRCLVHGRIKNAILVEHHVNARPKRQAQEDVGRLYSQRGDYLLATLRLQDQAFRLATGLEHDIAAMAAIRRWVTDSSESYHQAIAFVDDAIESIHREQGWAPPDDRIASTPADRETPSALRTKPQAPTTRHETAAAECPDCQHEAACNAAASRGAKGLLRELPDGRCHNFVPTPAAEERTPRTSTEDERARAQQDHAAQETEAELDRR